MSVVLNEYIALRTRCQVADEALAKCDERKYKHEAKIQFATYITKHADGLKKLKQGIYFHGTTLPQRKMDKWIKKGIEQYVQEADYRLDEVKSRLNVYAISHMALRQDPLFKARQEARDALRKFVDANPEQLPFALPHWFNKRT